MPRRFGQPCWPDVDLADQFVGGRGRASAPRAYRGGPMQAVTDSYWGGNTVRIKAIGDTVRRLKSSRVLSVTITGIGLLALGGVGGVSRPVPVKPDLKDQKVTPARLAQPARKVQPAPLDPRTPST